MANPSRPRCQAIVSGPPSRPRQVSSVRSPTIRSRTASGVRPGLVSGRREARLEGIETAVPIPAQEALQVLPAHPVLARRGGDGQLLGDDLEDSHSMLRHAPDCRACPDSPAAYQVSPMS